VKSLNKPRVVLTSAAESGSGSEAMNASSSLSERQSTGVLAPTPRGSKPTMSKLSSSLSPNTELEFSTYCTPEPPGPPGLTSNEPTRLSASSAAFLMIDSVSVSPCGCP
jgi:hypothetical protein